MADYGLAAQVGGGAGGGNAFNPLQTVAQYQNINNAMLQAQQFQQQMAKQNALSDILSRSGGKITPEINQALMASGNYEPALALQRHQTSMADAESVRALRNVQLQEAKLGLSEKQRDIAAKTAQITYLANTPNIADPDKLDALRKENPIAWTNIRKHIEDMREATAKADKEGRAAVAQQFDMTKKALGFIENILPSVTDQNSFTALRNYALAYGDKNLPNVIGSEYTPENMLRLKNIAQSVNNVEVKELANGQIITINKGNGTFSFLKPDGTMVPGGKLADLQGGGAPAATPVAVAPPVAPAPGMAPGITASMNATNAMPRVAAPAQAPANAMVQPPVDPLMAIKAQAQQRALATKEAEAAAIARGTAAGKTTAEEIALTPQLETAIKNIQDAIKPGGLLDKATSSGVGNIIDKSLGFLFGAATKGSIATAQLQPIADMALKLVPRFEGPQSDADRQSYVDAAGALADATKPIEVRRAAAQTIVRLMQERKDQFGVNKGQAGEGMPGERRAASSGPVTVQIPGGKSFSFPNQAAADKFRKEAGL